MEASVEVMIARFCQLQLSQVLATGSQVGLSPITTASTLLQICAASLADVARAETVALLRANADCIEAGPGDSPAQTAAQARFKEAAQRFIAVVTASASFPTPQGRA